MFWVCGKAGGMAVLCGAEASSRTKLWLSRLVFLVVIVF